MARGRPFEVIDVDSHAYEPESIWSDYVDAESREAVRRAFSRQGDQIILNGKPAKPLNRSTINRQAIWRPGMSLDEIGALDPTKAHAVNPGASESAARLADLDALGIDQQVVFPTLFGEYFPALEDPGAAIVLARAYNDWVRDFAEAGAGRLHPAAVLPLQDGAASIAELERCAERGFKSVLLRPMFIRNPDAIVGQSPTPLMGAANPNGVFIDHETFRPVWARIEELGLVACVHPYLGITNNEGASEGSFIERVSEKLDIGHTVAEPAAYMQDNALFVVIAMFHGLLEDYPRLKLALLHSGGAMIPLSIEKAETYLWLSPGSMMGAAPVSLEPEEVFERSRVVVGFDGWESSAVRLLDFFAAKGAWGSRYPNHDTSTPDEVIALCERYEVPMAAMRRLLGGNAADLFGLPVAAPA